MDLKVANTDQRTEEVQFIIERMPTKFGFWVSIIVIVIFVLMFAFGWFIRYPDIVIGQLTVTNNVAPLRLIANVSGKLKLTSVSSTDFVKEGRLIAYIENSTNPSSVLYIDSLLELYDPGKDNFTEVGSKLPHNFSLGELNSKYYTFSNALQEYINYKKDRLFDQQSQNLKALLTEQKRGERTLGSRVDMAKNALLYAHKFYARDSILFLKKVISESELDKTEVNYITAKDVLQNTVSNLSNAKQSENMTIGKMQELDIRYPETEKQLYIALISAYNDLLDSMRSWEQKYVFRATMDGKVQFLKFYHENQFIQQGEQIFTIIPEKDMAFGQLILPALGSGKVQIGQEVIVKLDDYPYMEYGSVSGKVKSLSLTTNTSKGEKSDVDTYLLLVDFPNHLKTNYGTKLDLKADAKGTGEIITRDRRLIERLFDNLKYVTRK